MYPKKLKSAILNRHFELLSDTFTMASILTSNSAYAIKLKKSMLDQIIIICQAILKKKKVGHF